MEGAAPKSKNLFFYPTKIAGGKINVEIGTAGSIPMLLITVLPICAFAENPVHIHISKGGTDVSHSPTINYICHILLPVLETFGLKSALTIHKYGYYPKGMGEVTIKVQPNPKLSSLHLEEFGSIKSVKGLSVCTFLAKQKVAERQAEAANKLLREHEYAPHIQIFNDFSNRIQKGSSLTLWAETSTGVILGGDAIGELGKPSEVVGREAAEKLLSEMKAKATADSHLADMLIPYMALVKGTSTFLARLITDHMETNMWLAHKILGVKFAARKVGDLYKVEKQAA
jgi:RNA 3'-terminal phosphate cyclase (ATP)